MGFRDKTGSVTFGGQFYGGMDVACLKFDPRDQAIILKNLVYCMTCTLSGDLIKGSSFTMCRSIHGYLQPSFRIPDLARG